MARRLTVNADDFGFTRDVNSGIIEAHRNGILTATTLMANGDAFDDAIRLARENPSLDVGVHVVLVQGSSVAFPGRHLPQTLPECMRVVFSRRLDVRAEVAAQIRKIREAGIEPTHIDSHKHTHLLPPVLEAVAEAAEEFGIRWVRKPTDLPFDYRASPLKRLAARGIQTLAPRMARALERHGCRSTDYFSGFALTGEYSHLDLVRLFEHLPEGLTEFMCHPGHFGDELRKAQTRLKESRAAELAALTHPEVRAALAEQGISLVRYRDL